MIKSLKSLLIAAVATGAVACSESPTAPAPEVVPQYFGDGEIPGPGEPCYPELHGPTCVPNENSYTGYAIAN